MDKKSLIKLLELAEHPLEAGYYRRTYESQFTLGSDENQRHILTSIYYLLTDDNPIGCFHQNRSDIIHYYHLGSPIKYFIVSKSGELREEVMGPDIATGQKLQLIVKGGDWKASQLMSGEFGLISEAVAPGFDYRDNQIADKTMFFKLFPHLESQVNYLFS